MTMPSAVISWSDALSRGGRLQRADGAASVSFDQRQGMTRLARLHQRGCAKIRLPKVAVGEPPNAVLINTAGGLTGGDRMQVAVAAEEGCRAIVTTQACERVYRSAGGAASVETHLAVGPGGRIDWLPQETILFDGSALVRRLDVDLAPGARLLACESLLFGRAAMQETMRAFSVHERWRIRRDGRLLFADDLRFGDADAALLGDPAILGGAGAMATILLVYEDAERCLEPVRAAIGTAGGASAWNGKLLARLTAADGMALRAALIPALATLLDGAALPQAWRS
jgi:urease accessory protein